MMGVLQLPPQIRTGAVVSWGLRLSKFSAKRACKAVRAARGIVEASAGGILEGTQKQIFSSARVYSLYPPRPLVSPAGRGQKIDLLHEDIRHR